MLGMSIVPKNSSGQSGTARLYDKSAERKRGDNSNNNSKTNCDCPKGRKAGKSHSSKLSERQGLVEGGSC